MPSGIRLTYGTLTLHSSEIVSFGFKRDFRINTIETVALSEITQPGNLSAIGFTVNTTIRDNASQKFTLWTNKLAEKALEPFTFLNRVWGNYYLTSLDITSSELDDIGDVLRFDMKIELMNNQNFG